MFAVQGCSIAAAPPQPPHPPTHTLLQPISVNQGLFGGGEGKSLLSGCRPHAMTLSKQSQLSAAGRGTVPCRPASLFHLGVFGWDSDHPSRWQFKEKCPLFKKKKIETRNVTNPLYFTKNGWTMEHLQPELELSCKTQSIIKWRVVEFWRRLFCFCV